jgi:hypothetical protein
MSVVFKVVLFNARVVVNAWRDALLVMLLYPILPLLLLVKETNFMKIVKKPTVY